MSRKKIKSIKNTFRTTSGVDVQWFFMRATIANKYRGKVNNVVKEWEMGFVFYGRKKGWCKPQPSIVLKNNQIKTASTLA